MHLLNKLNVNINMNILVRKTSKSFIVDVKGHVPNQTLILFWFKFNCHSVEAQKMKRNSH